MHVLALYSIQQGIKEVLAAGSDLNKVDPDGWTPLMFAANLGNLEIVQILIDSGADLVYENLDGNNALSIATAAQHTDVKKLILASIDKVRSLY